MLANNKLKANFKKYTTFIFLFIITGIRTSGTSDYVTEYEYKDSTVHKDKIIKESEHRLRLYRAYLTRHRFSDYIMNIYTELSECDINVPYSVTIAQNILESGYGNHIKHNNPFGIKDYYNGKHYRTFEYVNGSKVIKTEPFKVFETKRDSYEYHSKLLNNSYGIHTNTPINVCIKRLSRYATDINYSKKLEQLIDMYQLYKLDEIQRLNKYGDVDIINHKSIMYNK